MAEQKTLIEQYHDHLARVGKSPHTVKAYQRDLSAFATYTLTPAKSGYTFTPPTRANVSVPPNATGQDFTAIAASARCYLPLIVR